MYSTLAQTGALLSPWVAGIALPLALFAIVGGVAALWRARPNRNKA